jgi:RNA polymerase sigma-70 factor, ECF subfamily
MDNVAHLAKNSPSDDRVDFQEIYSVFQPKIYRYLTRLAGADEAEDLTQDVFIKAHQALPGFRGESSIATWLYRIATHTAYDRMRAASYRYTVQNDPSDESVGEGVEETIAGDPSGEEKNPSTEQEYTKKEMKACILNTIAKLPKSYRSVILLSDMEGLSNQEIAEILGITLDTVKIRLHRARTRLREELETHCEYYWVDELGWRVI